MDATRVSSHKNSSFTVHPYNGSQWGPSTVLVAVILQLSYDKMYFLPLWEYVNVIALNIKWYQSRWHLF